MGLWQRQKLLEIHAPKAGAFEAAQFDKVLHIEQRKAAAMLHLERLRHSQHAAGDFALRNRVLQGIGEDGGECCSAAARIPFLDDDALLANFLKRADRARKGEAGSEEHQEGEEANYRGRTWTPWVPGHVMSIRCHKARPERGAACGRGFQENPRPCLLAIVRSKLRTRSFPIATIVVDTRETPLAMRA